ncbi:hypothetical protein Tco_0559683 [Tanacetum coccineum]
MFLYTDTLGLYVGLRGNFTLIHLESEELELDRRELDKQEVEQPEVDRFDLDEPGVLAAALEKHILEYYLDKHCQWWLDKFGRNEHHRTVTQISQRFYGIEQSRGILSKSAHTAGIIESWISRVQGIIGMFRVDAAILENPLGCGALHEGVLSQAKSAAAPSRKMGNKHKALPTYYRDSAGKLFISRSDPCCNIGLGMRIFFVMSEELLVLKRVKQTVLMSKLSR